MSDSPNRSPRGSTTNPTLVENGHGTNGDLEHGTRPKGHREKDEKNEKGDDASKRSDNDASALETAVTGEAPEEGLDISAQEKARLDADPNVVDWEPDDPLYVYHIYIHISHISHRYTSIAYIYILRRL
jgi:hypothetical protein